MCDDPFSLNNSIRLLSSQLCQSCFAQLWQHEGTIKEVEITGLCSFSHFKDHLNAHGGVKTSQCSIRTGSPNQPYSSLLRCMTVVPPKHPQWPPADTAPPPPQRQSCCRAQLRSPDLAGMLARSSPATPTSRRPNPLPTAPSVHWGTEREAVRTALPARYSCSACSAVHK